MAEALTQAEIDALLSGDAMPEPGAEPSMITPEEDDTSKHYSGMVSTAGKDVFTTLMGEVVAPRRSFIAAHARSVQNLDV